MPGQQDAQRLTFERYTMRLGLSRGLQEFDSIEYATTAALWDDPNPRAQAQFQWRTGLPFMVFVLALIAQPLSRGEPTPGPVCQATTGGIFVCGLFELTACSGRCDWQWKALAIGWRLARASLVFRPRLAAFVALTT